MAETEKRSPKNQAKITKTWKRNLKLAHKQVAQRSPNDIENRWDGDFKGEEVEIGVYGWKILITDFNGRTYHT